MPGKKLEDWRRYYNEDRPHSGIGQIPPILLHNLSGASGPPLGMEAENSKFERGDYRGSEQGGEIAMCSDGASQLT